MEKQALIWYAVTANYKAVHLNKSRRRNLWEQTIFLIQAVDDNQAQQIGLEVAKSKEHKYKSATGEQIFWQFIEIVNIKDLLDQKLKQGMEVGWRFFERVDKPVMESGD